jgi:prepilin signal peptidase PulO-like enzyme (type II secretory pathway)
MNTLIITTTLGLIGLFFGSFAGAQVWRLRARQLREDEASGEKVSKHDKEQVSKLKKSPALQDRSVCLHCGHKLEWYDLIPLGSWLSLRGKCRYCHKHIGGFEPAIELTVGVLFAVSFAFWPYPLESGLDIAGLVIWLAAIVGMAVLTVYDAKWFLLPNRIVFPLIGLGVLYSFITLIEQQFAPSQWFNILYACLILSGLYYLIYIASRRQWVGFGDIKLGLALALLLADWQLAILALFLANVIGTFIILPMMLSGRIKRQARVPFGPLLISGWLLAGLFGSHIIDWYLSLALGSY